MADSGIHHDGFLFYFIILRTNSKLFIQDVTFIFKLVITLISFSYLSAYLATTDPKEEPHMLCLAL